MKMGWLIVAMLLGIVTVSEATVLDVPEKYSTIQKGIDAAEPRDTVLVAPGTYLENINFKGKKNLVVGSYFISTGDTSYISKTIIDGDQNGHVVEFSSGEDSTSVLSGLTLTNGGKKIIDNTYPENVFYGAGICCLNSSPHIEYLYINNNSILGYDGDAGGLGGGIYCEKSSPIIEHVTLSKNRASGGSGIYLYNFSSPRMNDILLFDNHAEEWGEHVGNRGISCINNSDPFITNVVIKDGGLVCDNSSPIVSKLTIEDVPDIGLVCFSANPVITDLIVRNIFCWEEAFGRGVRCSRGSKPLIRNALIHCIDWGIECEDGSDATFINAVIDSVDGDLPRGIYCNASSPVFVGVSISKSLKGNWSPGKGVFSTSHSNPVFINSIITDFECGVYCDGGTITVSHSNIWNNKLGNFYGAPDSLGVMTQVNTNGDSCDAFFNISQDPKFTDDGYHLSSDSPCIGAGTAKDAPEFDLLGITRHNPPDMGAYEFDRPVSVKEEVPTQFILFPNYPNPFNPSTTISFSLPKENRVELAIYSISGQRVRTLLSGRMSAGTYSSVWDGRDDSGRPVSSGVYLSRLTAGKNTAVRKMLLMK